MFRIRFIATQQFLKVHSGSMWYTLHLIINDRIPEVLTSGKGHSYNTKQGAVGFIKQLPPTIQSKFEIVEFKES